MRAMSPHEKECAFAACALRLELAQKRRDRAEAKEWRQLMKEIEAAPLLKE
jgi:hypothetical protein